MTVQPVAPSMTARPASQRLRALLGASNAWGFALRFALLMAALLLIPWLISLAGLPGPLRYLVPASGAVLIALAFLRRPAEALLALALFVLLYDTAALHFGSSIKQIDEMAVGLIFLLAVFRALQRWRSWVWLPRDLPLGAALAMGVISSLAADVPLATWFPALLLVTKAIVFFYVVMWTPFQPWEIRSGMWIVFTAGFGLFVLGLVELANPTAFQQFVGLHQLSSRGDLPVIKSLFAHPALFGWFTAFVALFLYAQYVITRRWYWLALALFLSLGSYLSARRRAILALWTGIAAGFVESLRRPGRVSAIIRAWTPVAAGSVLTVAVFMPALTGLYELTLRTYVPGTEPQPPGIGPGTIPQPLPPAGDDPRARIALYTGSVEIARDYFPLGGGLGRYASWMSRVDYSPLYHEYGLSTIRGLRPNNPQYATDTFWPQILGELGALGLTAYVGFLASLAYMLWRAAGAAKEPLLRLLTLGAGMIFAQAIVESMASSMFHSPPRVYLLYLAIGVVASIAWRSRDRTPTVSTRP